MTEWNISCIRDWRLGKSWLDLHRVCTNFI